MPAPHFCNYSSIGSSLGIEAQSCGFKSSASTLISPQLLTLQLLFPRKYVFVSETTSPLFTCISRKSQSKWHEHVFCLKVIGCVNISEVPTKAGELTATG